MHYLIFLAIIITLVNSSDNTQLHRFRTFRFDNIASTQTPAKKPVDNARSLPCCRDTNSGTACRLMYSQSELDFKTRCNTEPDFSLVGCCKTCNLLGVSFRERAKSFFSGKNASVHCFDRMSPEFCSRFDSKKDVWSSKKWNCNTSQSLIAFRVCRATCGFCDLDWENAPESRICY